MSSWKTQAATELVSLYAEYGRITEAQRHTLQQSITDGQVSEALTRLLRYDDGKL